MSTCHRDELIAANHDGKLLAELQAKEIKSYWDLLNMHILQAYERERKGNI